ncbi:hypothetical protein VW23_007205 [Devosia insulae DS-56]|uniref:Uncharacterized protein n=1 Tax=Devosia insulae DS-56 TaxID=1116389 RepID=A0A1E5XH41_9HYPH|nr:hypothetical protein [Devosia insulae]OEO27918.1 hypothetical protein VW23_007205 [Devosia insulae DS-56]
MLRLANYILRNVPDNIGSISDQLLATAEYFIVLGALVFAFGRSMNLLVFVLIVALIIVDFFAALRAAARAVADAHQRGASGWALIQRGAAELLIAALGVVTSVWVGLAMANL